MDGIINVNKPAGWTSQDVCAKLRSILHIKKIGHTGTLDPMATGVLPVCIGKATRIIEYYDKDYKSYEAVMQLGVTTDTLDITGEVLETSDYSHVTEHALREVLRTYHGIVEQLPPRYSALKVDGRRAYDLAREGKEFELPTREVDIKSNDLLDFDPDRGMARFAVTCSKGTYIRTICDDIGKALGCGAAMTSLVRTESGYFKLEDSVSLDKLFETSDPEINLEIDDKTENNYDDKINNRIVDKKDGTIQFNTDYRIDDKKDETIHHMIVRKIEDLVIPMDQTLTNLGIVELNDNRLTAFTNGNSSVSHSYRIIEESNFDKLYKVYACDKFIGIAEISANSLVPRKVLE